MGVDNNAPIVTAFKIKPGAIDTAYQPASFTVELNISDDLSGIQYVAIWFESPNGIHAAAANIWNFSGSSTERMYRETFSVAQYSDIGDYSVTVELTDKSGNTAYIYDLDKAFKTNLIITSGSEGVVSGNWLYIGSSKVLSTAQNNLQLTGFGNFHGTGNAAANVVYGNSGDNKISGLAGNDRLVGGAGNDTLIGGVGRDKLEGGSGIDVASYATATQGVVASLYSTAISTNDAQGDSYVSIENLTGSPFNDTLQGDINNNVLSGGAGQDALSGGAGNDTYIVDDVKDVVTELAMGGIDVIQSSVSVSLGNHIENLTLTGFAVVSGTGNSLANVIKGNASANILKGDTGADNLIGAAGDDILSGDAGADRIDGGAGFDTATYATATKGIAASLLKPTSNTLDAEGDTYVSVENLTGSKFADKLYGDAKANTLTGAAGNDLLVGGAGADKLNGGIGKDIFVFNATHSSSNVDTVFDFNITDDVIHLENAVFTNLGVPGALTTGRFYASTAGAAHDEDDRIIYETDTGKLFYDSNGNASSGSVHFATLSVGLALTESDFLVV